ncbi:MAG: viroplasmin family protein [Deltaproteobacteria bacterium]|nr:viroplasmin family protein [Deltaproteobacteria bacterium]
MSSRKKKNFYAYAMAGSTGIVTSWNECEGLVSGRNARYRGFVTRKEAQAWLDAGARYEDKAAKKAEKQMELPADALYFDAGTGRGKGTEVNVTDREGVPLAHLVADEKAITRFGTVLVRGKTNNYGELLACLYAIRIARLQGKTKLFGDSRLVLEYWSKNFVSAEKREKDPDLAQLAGLTAKERRAFEKAGGELNHVPGSINPADLGFHKD